MTSHYGEVRAIKKILRELPDIRVEKIRGSLRSLTPGGLGVSSADIAEKICADIHGMQISPGI